MTCRYRFAPKAARDLVQIWRYVRKHGGPQIADAVQSEILEKIIILAENPYIGHMRRDLTALPLRFFAVHSYLIAYRPDPKPLQIVGILHGNRDVQRLLRNRT